MLVTLPKHPEHTNLALDPGQLQLAQLSYSQSCSVEKLKHCPIPKAGGFGIRRSSDQTLYFFAIQVLRKAKPLLGRREQFRRVLSDGSLPEEESVEVSQCSN